VVLGVAYRPDISELGESPALDCIRVLLEQGARVSYNDPFVPALQMDNLRLKSRKLTEALVGKADLVAILTNHSEYDYQWIADTARRVFDTRNATKQVRGNTDKIERL
jgi:UDP-N-acetyl-D-glucosamine dehydrogenase